MFCRKLSSCLYLCHTFSTLSIIISCDQRSLLPAANGEHLLWLIITAPPIGGHYLLWLRSIISCDSWLVSLVIDEHYLLLLMIIISCERWSFSPAKYLIITVLISDHYFLSTMKAVCSFSITCQSGISTGLLIVWLIDLLVKQMIPLAY